MFDFLGRYYPAFLEGTAQTIIISIIASIIGILIGLLLVLMRISDNKILETISRVYISIVRGTPSMIQVMLIYYSLSKVLSIPPIHILGASLDRVLPGSIAKGQTEAGLSLGMTRHMVMFEIVLPQAVRNALPAMGNEFISLIKESSVLFYIGVQEVTAQALGVGGTLYDFVPPLIVAAAVYFVLTFTLSWIIVYFEKKMSRKYTRLA